MDRLGGSGETLNRLDSINGSDKMTAVATAAERNGLLRKGGKKMTVTAMAQT